MVDYFVRKTGSDAAAGTSAGAAWLTIGKALGAAGISSGDTVYVGAGTYRETIVVVMTSATVETFVIADVDGAKTGDAGEVFVSAYTTNDTTTPATSSLIDLAGRDFLTFVGFTLIGGNISAGSVIKGSVTNAVNIVLRDCNLYTGAISTTIVNYTSTANVAANWLIDRCRFFGVTGNGCIEVIGVTHTDDYDLAFLVQNSEFFTASMASVRVTASGAGAGKAGGVDALNCTHFSAGSFMSIGSANIATSIPCTAEGCFIVCNSAPFNANTSGQIVEDKNRVINNTANNNVTNGANSTYGIMHAPLFSIGQESYLGKAIRPHLTPLAGSPILGFQTPTGAPTVDILRRPRPAGGLSTVHAAGAYERHDTATETGSAVIAGTGNHFMITGPGDQDVTVLVDAAATDLQITMRYDTNHAATNKPQAILLPDAELGVVGETLTMAAAVDTDETIAFTQFTPTKAGAVTVRLVSRSAAANGIAYFADLEPV